MIHVKHGLEHKLTDNLAVIAGCEGWEERGLFDWLKKYGEFENGVPSHHTIARVAAVVAVSTLLY